MVAPTYDTDLNDINLAEAVTDWAEPTNHKDGGAATFDQDYFIQGGGCVTQAQSGKTGTVTGLYYDATNPIAFGSRDCFFGWHVLLAGNATAIFHQGGMRWGIGSSDGNYNIFKAGGADFARNPYGGWHNVAIWPSYTPIDYVEGTPTANTYQVFMSNPNLSNAISKGNLHGCDALRYGRGIIYASGGNLGDGYATFEGLAAENDLQANRWGLFQEQAGGFLTKGIISIGAAHDVSSDNSSAAFFDSNRNITIDNTPRTYRDFNKVEIRNTGTFVYWDNIQLAPVSAGGSLARGILEVIDSPSGVGFGYEGLVFESCVFTDMFEHIYLPNCYLYNTTYRRTGTVYQNRAVFNGCLFDESPSAVALEATDIERITNTDFVSQGTGHAIELGETHIQGAEYDLDTCTFTGYAATSGSTGNEAVYNNSGNLITLRVLGGVDSPSIRNGSGANTIVVQTTTYTLTGIVANSEVQIVPQDWADDGSVTPDENLYHLENTTEDDGTGQGTTKAVYSYNYTTDIPIYVYIHKLGYEWLRVRDTLTNENKVTPVSQKIDRVYSNPTGISKTKSWGLRPTDDYNDFIDSYMDTVNNTTNYGSSTDVKIDGTAANEKYGIMGAVNIGRIIPSNATINSATLYMYIYNNTEGAGGATISTDQIARDWKEGTVTWDIADTGLSWTTGGAGGPDTDYYSGTGDTQGISSGQTGWFSFDCTSDVQDYIDGTRSDFYGYRIVPIFIGGGTVDVRSSEYTGDTSLRPYLEVSWTQ